MTASGSEQWNGDGSRSMQHSRAASKSTRPERGEQVATTSRHHGHFCSLGVFGAAGPRQPSRSRRLRRGHSCQSENAPAGGSTRAAVEAEARSSSTSSEAAPLSSTLGGSLCNASKMDVQSVAKIRACARCSVAPKKRIHPHCGRAPREKAFKRCGYTPWLKSASATSAGVAGSSSSAAATYAAGGGGASPGRLRCTASRPRQHSSWGTRRDAPGW